MPTPARQRPLIALAVAAFVAAALLGSAAGAPADAKPGAITPRVLVLGGGDAASDAAVLAALQADGLEAVSGPETETFAGNRQSLREYDVVVALAYDTGAPLQLTAAGAEALGRYVELGGSLVVGGWAASATQLRALLPALGCGSNGAATTTYSRLTPSAFLDEGVPASFTLALAPAAITESCLQPKDEAAVLYSSSNGGGRDDAAGLAAWNVGLGRVAAFSALLRAADLQSAGLRALFLNTVTWVGSTRDTTPPTIKSFAVSGAGGLTGQRQVQITLTASDSGGSGLGSYFIREFAYSGDPADGWEQDGTSAGWQPYEQPGVTTTWTLSATPGVRYIQVFVADRAGNITRAAAEEVINYVAPGVAIAQDETHIYRIRPGAGAITTVRMDALSGNPDLYVFGPQVSFAPESDGTPEQTTFTAREGTYQVEVSGFTAASYTLSVQTSPGLIAGPGGLTPDRRPRISPTEVSPAEPPEDPSNLPAAPVDPGAAALTEFVYLPLIRQ